MFFKRVIKLWCLLLCLVDETSGSDDETTSVLGAPFIEPDSCSSLTCLLNLDVYQYQGPYAKFKTRAYNSKIPGPTIRVSAGDAFAITVNNSLQDIDSKYTSPLNTFRHANLTGLHTHGLHIGSDEGGDDIFHEILPTESSTYRYNLPVFHSGGTFWYHPHHHGSTALQTGGGAMGLIIVEDAENEVPPFLTKLTEKCLVLNHINILELSEIQSQSNEALLQPTQESAREIMLLNGQTAPVMNINAREWYRFRVLFSSASSYFRFQFDDNSCEMQLIAKDGVYLLEAPRQLYELPLYPGARCDVLVRCDGSKALVNMTGFPNNGGTLIQEHVWNGTVLTLNISSPTSSSLVSMSSLPSFSVFRPCYLIDTTNISSSVVYNTSVVNLNIGGPTINGERFMEKGDYIDSFPVGSLVELSILGVRGHPFHLHINSFQIVYVQEESDYFHLGDYHDTFFFGKGNDDPEVRVRFFTDTFVGSMVLHCHLLTHEDTGMMAEMEITGTEGTVFSTAELYDPHCYRDASGRGYSVNVSLIPSSAPSMIPSGSPSTTPSFTPSSSPSFLPTTVPTLYPSLLPTVYPSLAPSGAPSPTPSEGPTSMLPIPFPSIAPTAFLSTIPTPFPSRSPSCIPTTIPSSMPSTLPSALPSALPSGLPTMLPSTLSSSSSRCNSLNWNFTLVDESLCIGECFGITSPLIALSSCEEFGARVCTMSDMASAQSLKGGGLCDADDVNVHIWTGTKCGNSSWFTVSTNTKSTNTACIQDSEFHFAQCCFGDVADSDEAQISSFFPTAAPTGYLKKSRKGQPSGFNMVFSSIWGNKYDGKYIVASALFMVVSVVLFVVFCALVCPRRKHEKRSIRIS